MRGVRQWNSWNSPSAAWQSFESPSIEDTRSRLRAVKLGDNSAEQSLNKATAGLVMELSGAPPLTPVRWHSLSRRRISSSGTRILHVDTLLLLWASLHPHLCGSLPAVFSRPLAQGPCDAITGIVLVWRMASPLWNRFSSSVHSLQAREGGAIGNLQVSCDCGRMSRDRVTRPSSIFGLRKRGIGPGGFSSVLTRA